MWVDFIVDLLDQIALFSPLPSALLSRHRANK